MTRLAVVAAAILLANAGCEHGRTSGRLFTLSEATERGELKAYPEGASVVDADPNSAVRVVPSESELRTFLPPRRSDPALVARLNALTVLQDRLNASMSTLEKAAGIARAVHARGGKATREERDAFLAVYRALDDAQDAIDDYAQATGQKDQLDALIAARGGSPQLYRDWVAAQSAAVEEQLGSSLAKGERNLELAAWIGRPAAQVHVPGYDSLTPGLAHSVDKMTFSSVPPEEMEAAKALSTAVSSSNGIRAAALKGLEKLETQLADVQKSLAEKVRAVVASAKAQTDKGFADVVTKAQAAEKACTAAVTGIEGVVKVAAATSQQIDPAAGINQLVAGLTAVAGEVKKCGQALTDVRDSAEAMVANESKVLQQAGARVRDDAEGAIAAVAQVIAWNSDGEAASIPQLRTIAVPVTNARATEISLLETDRREGDVLTIRARVLERDGKVAPGGEATRHVRIRARPLVADTGAVVFWVRGVKADPGPFVPGAGAYAVVRFTGWRDEGDAGSPFFHLLAPGLGIAAVAVPQATDGSNKLAWMGTAQLFGDVLQVGAGVTLDGNPVWGFGVGLHRIAGVGKYLQ